MAVGILAAALLAGCGGTPETTGDGPRSPVSEIAAPSLAATPTPEPTDAGAAAQSDPALPAQAPAAHGGTAVAVYLAVTDQGYDSPAIEQAQVAASDLGYEVGAGSLGCDQGAAEALGYETGSEQARATVALYFATPEEAARVRAVAQAAGHTVEGMAEVTTYCLD